MILNKIRANINLCLWLICGGVSALAHAHAASEAPDHSAFQPLPSVSPAMLIPEYEDIAILNSKTVWVIEKFKFQNESLLLSLAAIRTEDPLGLSVLVLDPPPQELIYKALRSALIESRIKTPTEHLPLKDVSNSASGKTDAPLPHALLHLKSTSIRLADIASAQDAVLQAVANCAPGMRRAVAFVHPMALEQSLGISADRAAEWSQYGRAACIEWNALPDSMVKSHAQTETLRP